MAIDIDQIAPDFEQDTVNGSIRLYEWLGHNWCVLFTHDGGHSLVSLTEIAEVIRLKPCWDGRKVRMLGMSCYVADVLQDLELNLEAFHGQPVNFPLVTDFDGSVARLYGIVQYSEARQAAYRIFVIDLDHRVRASLAYPPNVERNFADVLRVVDTLQSMDTEPNHEIRTTKAT